MVGLDVSRRFHVAYTVSQKKPFTFEHHRADFEKFNGWLRSHQVRCPYSDWSQRGLKTRVLAHYLLPQGWQVNIVLGVHVKRIKLVYNNSVNANLIVDETVSAL